MPVTATAWLRTLRGGSQTHLLEAGDKQHYVVKLTNNPQGLRTLLNEWIAQRIMRYLRIPCPDIEIIDIPQSVIDASPKLGIERSKVVTPPVAGWHFGSRYPLHPSLHGVHDILGEAQLLSCRNLHHFAAALTFDKWTANADARQCIFYRARLVDVMDDDGSDDFADSTSRGLVASMIDQGYCFNGGYWDFPDAPGFGLYYRADVYRKIRGWKDFEPWLERIQCFPTSVLDQAFGELPRAWMTPRDEEELPILLERLFRRRSKVASLIEATHDRYPNHFVSWR
ncbi:HipA family kinase [Bryobacter aggregatus]|uniref:HipA family kinase n=1 Tax=Bryobacter aggregatus TaxID=360054 RepID=UPI0004E0FC95|nr:HipA family kinase [Bryobacter aggregatus]